MPLALPAACYQALGKISTDEPAAKADLTDQMSRLETDSLQKLVATNPYLCLSDAFRESCQPVSALRIIIPHPVCPQESMSVNFTLIQNSNETTSI